MDVQGELIDRLRRVSDSGFFQFLFVRVQAKGNKETDLGYWTALVPAETRVLKFNLAMDPSGGPFSPFLSLILKRFQDLPLVSRESVLKNLDLYQLHQAWFRGWLRGESFDRWDDVLRVGDELSFERTKIYAYIYRLLDLLWPSESVLFVLESLEMASPSLISFLMWGLTALPKGRHTVLGVSILGGKNASYWSPSLRQDFFSLLEKTKSLILSPLKDVAFSLQASKPRVRGDEKTRLNHLKLVRHFLCIEDGPLYIRRQTKAKSAIEVEGAFEMGLVLAFAERFNEALVPLQTALAGTKTLAMGLRQRVLLTIAWCYFKKMDRAFAEKYLRLAIQLKDMETTSPDAMLGILVQMMVHEELYENPVERKRYFSWIEALILQGQGIHALTAQTTLSYYRAVAQETGWKSAVDKALAVMSQVDVLGNFYQKAKIYHQLAYLHKEPDPEKALGYFALTISCRRDLGSSLGLVKDYNGAGYFNMTQGHLAQALEYFQEALKLLTTTKDFTETCLTLFNVSLVYLLSGSFQRALELYQVILGVLDDLEMDSLPWHSRGKLECLAGICAYFLDQRTFSLDYWERIISGPQEFQKGPAFLLFRALIGDLIEGQKTTPEDYDLAVQGAKSENWLNFASFGLFQKGLFLKQKGLFPEAENAFFEALILLGNRDESIQRSLYLTWWEVGQPGPHLFSFDQSIENIAQRIRQSSAQEASGFALRRKFHEMSFLKDFQDRVTRDMEESQLFKSARDVILQFFPMDSMHFFEIIQGEVKILVGHPAKKTFPEVFEVMNLPGITSTTKARTLSSPHSFSVLVPIHNQRGRELWLGLLSNGTLGGLTRDDAQTVQMAVKHLELSLDLHGTAESLQKSITTDHLTGAFSRHEFLRRAEKEIQRTVRYSKSSDRRFSLLFMDLDNFKYYNDTFGHGAGDLILKLFSGLVRSCIRDLDSFGRFGGDEFVLLLPETPEKGARVVGQRILTKLQDPGGFRKALREALEVQELPVEKLLGCSLGLCEFSADSGLTLEDLLEKADQGLYRAKRAGKNQIG